MPPTTAQRTRLSDAFISRVSNVLNQKMFDRFMVILKKKNTKKNEVGSSSSSGSSSSNTADDSNDNTTTTTDNTDNKTRVEKLNAHLKWYPTLCNRIVGIVDDHVLLLRNDCLSTLVVPDLPPHQRFTSDILLGIVPFLTYPAIGRLARSCKWMHGNITQEQADKAVKRGQEVIRRITLFTEPSGRQMLRFFSVEEEEPIEFGRILEGSQVFVIRFRNRTFMGAQQQQQYSLLGLGEFFTTMVKAIVVVEKSSSSSSSTTTAGTTTTTIGGDTTTTTACAWFKVINNNNRSTDCLHMRFFMRSGNNNTFKWRLTAAVDDDGVRVGPSKEEEHFDVGFHEYKTA
jgi:hypothetical protein